MAQKDELMSFAEEEVEVTSVEEKWKILVVDDDVEVHTVTTLALRKLKVLDKKIHFLHAYSALEAKEILANQSGIAVILLDVVMETDDAGLKLVNFIRSEQNYRNIRIILRTGQPGSAPELEVIQHYEIDDYEMKSELTRTRLVTSITTAIRSYYQLSMISVNRDGLKKIIDWGTELMARRNANSFAVSVLEYITLLLSLPKESLFCVAMIDPSQKTRRPTIKALAGLGRYSELSEKDITQLEDRKIIDLFNQCLIRREHIFNEDTIILYMKSHYNEALIYLKSNGHMNEIYRNLLGVFCSYSAVCFENVKLFEKLNFAAYYDNLTNLPNRLHCVEVLDQYTIGEKKKGECIALIDIEHFHDINVSLGQQTGEQLLVTFAQRLTDGFGRDCYISRIGSHSFGILGSDEIVKPERIYELFSKTLKFSNNAIPVSLKIGICENKYWKDNGIDVLRKTSVALEYAKRQSENNHCYYQSKLTKTTQNRLQLMHRLKQALTDEKLQVWYQPQIDLNTKAIVGVEALIRWQDEDNNFIPPNEFIPVAENSGLIVDIGAWVLKQALEDIQEINQSSAQKMKVSVNVSVTQFKSSSFISQIKRLESENVDLKNLLELEITENVVMDNHNEIILVLNQLKELGIELALDDFGTGFSSLSYLANIPFDTLKIDRAFVINYQEEIGKTILDSIVLLGKQLKKRIICEGIETIDQAEYLRSLQCEIGQGFLYYKPMPLQAFKEILLTPTHQ
ncbi:bifunctional diguanylate cyclase/phosphodiesterase [Aliikangiella coralliicola]|uniref:EAL domain-containing protein n=1 Tax=Aliikangiella coralliicola TaxID=2592383 RepID=A0A545UHW3_9GAMM|nr:EAL domain-containing protein [Aliikangiella coralliicola]TQV89003.1 EAL domain-containing protein [Aliikangiella coralliicola]